MKCFLVAVILTSVVTTAAYSQEVSVDLGLGVQAKPTYPGADDSSIAPWFIWRNVSFGADDGSKDGFSLQPSFSLVGDRETSDDAALEGLDEIERAYEVGARLNYVNGPVTAYASMRRGFKGHEGLTGEVGMDYRTVLSDRVSLWSGVELGFANSKYTNTYFGVTPDEASRSPYSAYDAGGGLTSAAIKFQAAYAVNDKTALLGEVSYGKLLGDAADSPIVQEEWQPSLKLGVVRRFFFGF